MEKRQQIQQRSRLGTLLVHRGLISRQQLDEALTIQAQTELLLGEVLIGKGWLTDKQLNKALRSQSRYRLMALLGALLIGPIQPFITQANAAETTVVAEQYTDSLAGQELSEQELANISGQGLEASSISTAHYERLLDVVNNNLNLDDTEFATTTLESLFAALAPGAEVLDASIELNGVRYEPGPRTTLNQDGSLDVQLPTSIKQLAFKNIKIAGMEGSHLGDVVVRDLQFGDNTSIKVYLR